MRSIPGPGRFRMLQSNKAHAPQLLNLHSRAPALHQEKLPQGEARALGWRVALARPTYRNPTHSSKDPAQPSINKLIFFKKAYTGTFIAALFIAALKWKQPTYPPNDEWINIMWYIYTVECSLAIRRNEARVRATTHMKLENIKWKKTNTKTTYCMISFLHWRH